MKGETHRKNHIIGPGGIRCDCCRPFTSLKKTRALLNRRFRRATRQECKRMPEPDEEEPQLPDHIADLPIWRRWGPHGGPKFVYECDEQPDYATRHGNLVVWAALPSWMQIQIDPWYYKKHIP